MFKIEEVIKTISVFRYGGVFDICDSKVDAISNILMFAREFDESSFEELMVLPSVLTQKDLLFCEINLEKT